MRARLQGLPKLFLLKGRDSRGRGTVFFEANPLVIPGKSQRAHFLVCTRDTLRFKPADQRNGSIKKIYKESERGSIYSSGNGSPAVSRLASIAISATPAAPTRYQAGASLLPVM